MTTIAEKLIKLAQTKAAIKQVLTTKGVDVSATPFEEIHTKIETDVPTVTSPTSWVRPSDWLTLPTVSPTDQKFVGLHAVHSHSNFLALSAAGAYTVDWGDGTVENFAANAVAQHEYNYVTYDTGNATLCSRGYKQAIVTVTPQAGQSLTTLNLHQRHSAEAGRYVSGFLDIAVAGALLSDLRVAVESPTNTTQLIKFTMLERVNIAKCSVQSFKNIFNNCSSLRCVVDVNTTATAVNMSYMFIYCSTLTEVPLFNTSAVTNMLSMFQSCRRLSKVPQFDTGLVTTMGNMFYECSSLKSVPQFDTKNVESFWGMFDRCYALTKVPELDMSEALSVGEMFQECYSLSEVHLKNMGRVSELDRIFGNCFLNKVTLGGLKESFSISYNQLAADSLNALYSSLGTAPGKTITVTGNAGTTGDNQSIAEDKGWDCLFYLN